MLSDKPKLVFSGLVNNNATDKMISEAIYRASGLIKPEKLTPEQQYLKALYLKGEATQ